MTVATLSADVVFIVEGKRSVRTTIGKLLRSVGLQARLFSSARQFLNTERPVSPSCVVLGVDLPDMSGLRLQSLLADRREDTPIIFIGDQGDVQASVQAMKAGALEFFTKPFRGQDLLDAVRRAVERNHAGRERRAENAELEQRWSTLTRREREVFGLVVSGLLNKQIAAELGASEKTIKVHRGQVMRKMKAGSVAELVRFAERLRISPSTATTTTAGR